jgi:hypothetical protein
MRFQIPFTKLARLRERRLRQFNCRLSSLKGQRGSEQP